MRFLRHVVGLSTLLAGVIGGLYLWSLLDGSSRSDELQITILFDSAEGLAPGADVRFRGVRVGEVRRVRLGPGGAHAEVECALRGGVGQTVGTTTRFWIVRPRFTGIQRGATGLETLIKDSYVSYSSPAGHAPPLSPGARVLGLTAPPEPDALALLGTSAPGELEVQILLTETAGLAVGSPVRYRGIPVGRVTSVQLAPDTTAVRVEARIAKRYRSAVRDDTVFWVTRPEVTARWMSGISVSELDTLLAGVYLSFYSPDPGRSGPAPDGALFVGALSRPPFDWPELSATSASQGGTAQVASGDDPQLQGLVRVHLTFVERDWLSPNDRYSIRAPGLAFRTKDDLLLAVVARSAVDPSAIVQERSPSIRDELLRVEFLDGSVHEAGRLWIDPEADLAIIQIAATGAPIGPLAQAWHIDDERWIGPVLEILTFEDDGEPIRFTATAASDHELTGVDARAARGFALFEKQFVGLVGQALSAEPPSEESLAIIPLDRIPAPLRPARSGASAPSAEPPESDGK